MIDKVFDTAFASNDRASSFDLIKIIAARIFVLSIQFAVIAGHLLLIGRFRANGLVVAFFTVTFVCSMLAFVSESFRELIVNRITNFTKQLYYLHTLVKVILDKSYTINKIAELQDNYAKEQVMSAIESSTKKLAKKLEQEMARREQKQSTEMNIEEKSFDIPPKKLIEILEVIEALNASIQVSSVDKLDDVVPSVSDKPVK